MTLSLLQLGGLGPGPSRLAIVAVASHQMVLKNTCRFGNVVVISHNTNVPVTDWLNLGKPCVLASRAKRGQTCANGLHYTVYPVMLPTSYSLLTTWTCLPSEYTLTWAKIWHKITTIHPYAYTCKNNTYCIKYKVLLTALTYNHIYFPPFRCWPRAEHLMLWSLMHVIDEFTIPSFHTQHHLFLCNISLNSYFILCLAEFGLRRSHLLVWQLPVRSLDSIH